MGEEEGGGGRAGVEAHLSGEVEAEGVVAS